jgi:anti-sigma regulatory factor (Ser/Thr protein kinase)/serine/threonine protein phosphatase PrpC
VVVIPITNEIDTFIARRAGREMAREAGFSSRDYSLIEIAVSELTTNVIKYASRGIIRLRPLPEGMEIVCEDEGPGIADADNILARKGKKGRSQTGLGIGLIGVSNMMDHFEISAEPGRGTTITARKWKVLPAQPVAEADAAVPDQGLLEYGALSAPYQQGEMSGDALVIQENEPQVLLGVIDGLGHGPEAYRASQKAAAYIRANSHLNLTNLLEDCHTQLLRTRGAVIGLAKVDLSRSLVTCAVVGNVTIKIAGPRLTLQPLALPGIIGHRLKPVREEVFPFLPGDFIFIHSDGISNRLDPESLDFGKNSCRKLAENIIQEFGKFSDDQTILVARRRDAQSAE